MKQMTALLFLWSRGGGERGATTHPVTITLGYDNRREGVLRGQGEPE